MRFAQKKKILLAIETMKEAQEFIWVQCEQQQSDAVYEMLVQLQEMAVQIGNILEEERGHEEVVAELESYCEQIYECSIELLDYELVLKESDN